MGELRSVTLNSNVCIQHVYLCVSKVTKMSKLRNVVLTTPLEWVS